MTEAHNQNVAVVTGASAGIGKEVAKALVAQGWHVIGTGRDATRCAEAASTINAAASNGGRFAMVRADMALLADTARMADEIIALTPRIDVLVCNAGGIRDKEYVSSEGHEATFATNHLAHFLLLQKLMPLLVKTAQQHGGVARVLSTSSDANDHCPAMNWDDLNFAHNFSVGAAYCQAKLANVLFTRELAKRGAVDGIVANVIHPGPVTSNFWSHGDEVFKTRIDTIRDQAVTPEKAAETLVWLATASEAGAMSGQYYYMGAPRDPSVAAQDAAAATRLWEMSEALTAGY